MEVSQEIGMRSLMVLLVILACGCAQQEHDATGGHGGRVFTLSGFAVEAPRDTGWVLLKADSIQTAFQKHDAYSSGNLVAQVLRRFDRAVFLDPGSLEGSVNHESCGSGPSQRVGFAPAQAAEGVKSRPGRTRRATIAEPRNATSAADTPPSQLTTPDPPAPYECRPAART